MNQEECKECTNSDTFI